MFFFFFPVPFLVNERKKEKRKKREDRSRTKEILPSSLISVNFSVYNFFGDGGRTKD